MDDYHPIYPEISKAARLLKTPKVQPNAVAGLLKILGVSKAEKSPFRRERRKGTSPKYYLFEVRVNKLKWLYFKHNNLRAQECLCHYCGTILNFKAATLDHKKPKSKGGLKRCVSNIVLACAKCNQEKGSKSYEEFCESKAKEMFAY